jgi:hypothetical protein
MAISCYLTRFEVVPLIVGLRVGLVFRILAWKFLRTNYLQFLVNTLVLA